MTNNLKRTRDGSFHINNRTQNSCNFLNIPTDVHSQLKKYLSAKDIKTLTQTCTRLKKVYDKFRWVKCVLYDDEDRGFDEEKFNYLDGVNDEVSIGRLHLLYF